MVASTRTEVAFSLLFLKVKFKFIIRWVIE